jgi:hypothetical protein
MIVRKILWTGIAALALGGAAQAQTPGSASTPNAATLAAARELMRVADVKGQMHALMPRMAQAMSQQMQQQFVDKKVPDGLAAQFTAALRDFMGSLDGAFTPAVIDEMAMVYARHFSESDLRHLSALLGDPAMLRYRAEMPNVVSDEMPILFAAMKPQQDAFQAKMKQITADWIRTHPEDKAKLAHPTS